MQDKRPLAPIVLGLMLVTIGSTKLKGTPKLLALGAAIVLLVVGLVLLYRQK